MAGDVRGHDLDSWWQNRAAFRQDATQAASQWRAAADRYSNAAGGAAASASVAPPNETFDSLSQAGESAIATLQNARAQLAGLDGERQRAQSDYSSEQNAIEAACKQRVYAEREAAGRKAQANKAQLEKSMVVVRKFVAIGIFAVVLYLLVIH